MLKMKSKVFSVFVILSLFVVLTISCKHVIDEKEKEHRFGEWKIEKEATCTSDGLKKRVCIGCGFEETETIPAKGHLYDSGVITTKPTCTGTGIKTYTCSRCKEVMTESIPALGHAFNGIKCDNCGEYSVKLSEVGKTYTDADGLNIKLNSFSCKKLNNFTTIYNGSMVTINNYNLYSINYDLINNASEIGLETGAFKIIYKTASGSIESSYFSASTSPLMSYNNGVWKTDFQTEVFDSISYNNTITKDSEWLLPNNITFICLEYIANSQVNEYLLSSTPSDEVLNWILEDFHLASVSNLKANFNSETNTITVNWKNPTDSDFDYVELSYTKGGVSNGDSIKIQNESYTVNDVRIDGDEYIFSVCAVDKNGNKSATSTYKITPTGVPVVKSITLNRYHLAYNDSDQTVKVWAKIINAYLIEDGTAITIQAKDSNGNITNTLAELDKNSGTVSAILRIPDSSLNATSNGNTYTVMCKIGNELADTIHTTRFNVSSDTVVNGINKSINNSASAIQVPLYRVNSETRIDLTLNGYNLDLTRISVQLINSTGGTYFAEPIEIDNSSISWTATSGENKQSLGVSLEVPQIDDVYLVRFLFDGVIQEGYLKLQVYDVPKFSNFSIPLVSTTKAGNRVTAKVTGKNFDTPDSNLGNLIATCTKNSTIVSSTTSTKESDSVIYVSLIIPEEEGEYDVTIAYGDNSITSKLKAKDFSNYSVGDVLLNDDTIIPFDADNISFTEEQKQNAICVLAYFNDYGIPVGVGLYNSMSGVNNGKYQWAPKNSIGYDSKFSKIVCTPSDEGSGKANSVTFTGDIDGSDNWTYICSEDSLGELNASIYYPAFDYVNNYAANFGLIGKYGDGWYMPTIAELCFIYKNKNVLNLIINALGGVQFEDRYYSSSQNEVGIGTWFLRFSTGYVGKTPKDYDNYICVVRPFEQ